ncbi:hypothetical protein BN135_1195 [Cronobacter muytjensii 530]
MCKIFDVKAQRQQKKTPFYCFNNQGFELEKRMAVFRRGLC